MRSYLLGVPTQKGIFQLKRDLPLKKGSNSKRVGHRFFHASPSGSYWRRFGFRRMKYSDADVAEGPKPYPSLLFSFFAAGTLARLVLMAPTADALIIILDLLF